MEKKAPTVQERVDYFLPRMGACSSINVLATAVLHGCSLEMVAEMEKRGYAQYNSRPVTHQFSALWAVQFKNYQEAAWRAVFLPFMYEPVTNNESIMTLVYDEPGLKHVKEYRWLLTPEWCLRRYDSICTVIADPNESRFADDLLQFCRKHELFESICEYLKEDKIDRSIAVTFIENARASHWV